MYDVLNSKKNTRSFFKENNFYVKTYSTLIFFQCNFRLLIHLKRPTFMRYPHK